jgi:hypothetical protein
MIGISIQVAASSPTTGWSINTLMLPSMKPSANTHKKYSATARGTFRKILSRQVSIGGAQRDEYGRLGP